MAYRIHDTQNDIHNECYYIDNTFKFTNSMPLVKRYVIFYNESMKKDFDTLESANEYIEKGKKRKEKTKEKQKASKLDMENEIFNIGIRWKKENKPLEKLNYTPFTWRWNVFMKGYNSIDTTL